MNCHAKDEMIPLSSNVNVTFEGLEELLQQLVGMSNTQAVKKNALEKAGDHLSEAIANAAPVRTGLLKESIIRGDVSNDKIYIGPSQQGPSYRTHFLEYGTSKMSARPFMRPTFEAEKSRLEQIMRDEIQRGLGL